MMTQSGFGVARSSHITRSTTWEDPRKVQHQQILAAVGGGVGSTGTPSQAQSSNAASATAMLQGPTQAVGPLPEGWEQSMTPEGEVYFINHVLRTTSWFDPRLPAHLQRPPVLQQQLNAAAIAQSAASASAAPNPGNASLLNQQSVQVSRQQEVRLQQLQLERERLKLRQQEIMRQMDQEKALLRQQNRLGQVSMEDGVELDPFLGGSMANPSTPSSNSDYHSRQESADSGLGMGTYPSVPNTPEDILSTMDDNMDTISENELGASMDPSDIVSLGSENVESTDDLVPSLQLSEELSNELLLDEMQSIINSKTDNTMTWL
ncbi:unnamed protein product [Allacma fusca]|uniref:WW domain-containing protein n=1 Tax=Allacma fusca TaxID=39272 RepID=A0A8J2L599_9HEXA|nr:unnamed protein product [Allacma fusca]